MASKVNVISPMSEFVDEELEEIDETVAEKFKYDPALGGKWMLFYNKEYIDEMWKQAVALYQAGELDGVVSVRTSTSAQCLRAGTTDNGVIRFMCGPCDDEQLILKYGFNLIKKMKYFSAYGFVAYKTDDQSLIGTCATGSIKNYQYRLPASTHDHTKKWSGNCSECPIEVPSLTWHKLMLQEALHSIIVEQISDPTELSMMLQWRLLFEAGPPLDSAWANACRLYRSRQLVGVVHMTSSTAKAIHGTNAQNKGVIIFYSDNKQPLSELKTIGSNLVFQFKYSDKHDGLACTLKNVGSPGYREVCRVPAH